MISRSAIAFSRSPIGPIHPTAPFSTPSASEGMRGSILHDRWFCDPLAGARGTKQIRRRRWARGSPL